MLKQTSYASASPKPGLNRIPPYLISLAISQAQYDQMRVWKYNLLAVERFKSSSLEGDLDAEGGLNSTLLSWQFVISLGYSYHYAKSRMNQLLIISAELNTFELLGK